MQTLDQVSAAVKAHVPEILDELQAVCGGEPWCALPPQDPLNNLAEVTSDLVEVALSSTADKRLLAEEVYAAARHGEDRLKIGCPEDLLFAEYALLRHVLRRFVRSQVPVPVANEASARLDAATEVATAASLTGYRRPEFEAAGTWPQVLDRLTNEWPYPKQAPESSAHARRETLA